MTKGRLLFYAALAMALTSMWLRAAYPTLGIWGSHDDALFVRLARAGRWLGGYDSLTLAKGAFFPIFLALNKVCGFPLKLLEHALYLLASLLAAHAIARVMERRFLFLPAFTVLALSPLPWMIEGGSRVTREPLYQTLSLALVALAVLYFLAGRTRPRLGIGLGLVGGCYWLTREEGIWLMPALAVLVVFALGRELKRSQRVDVAALKAAARHVSMPLAGFMAVVLLVNSMNWLAYGVFRNNDFRSGPFAHAYGALARIKHDEWKRYVVFPRDARLRAYSVSPAARELEPFFEGEAGRGWARIGRHHALPWGCAGRPEACNDEILSPWFVWALRDAVTTAGHYRSAKEADAFYERLAAEIDAACERETIPCRDARNTMAPVWRGHYTRDALKASGDVLATLVGLGGGRIGVLPSDLTPEQTAIFRTVVHGPLSGIDDKSIAREGWKGQLNEWRDELTRGIAAGYASLSGPLFMFALASYLFVLVAWMAVKSPAVSKNAVAVSTALLVAVLSRVGLLGFLEATSIPSNNLLYLLPVVSIYLLFVVVAIATAGDALRTLVRGYRPRSS